MALNIGELNATITLNARQFTAGLRDAQTQVARASSSIKKGAGGMGKAFVAMGRHAKTAAMAAAAAGAALALAGKKAVDVQLEFEGLDRQMIAVAGSTEKANADFQRLREIAGKLGTPLDELVRAYGAMGSAAKGTLLEGEPLLKLMEEISIAGSVLGKTGPEMGLAFKAVSQMMSIGTIQAEELKGQLAEHLPMAIQATARALGVTTAEIGKMMESGALASEYVLPLLGKQLRKELGGAAESAAKGLAGAVGRMKMAWWDLTRALVTGVAEAKIGQEFAFMGGAVKAITGWLRAMIPYVVKVREYFAAWGPDIDRAMVWLRPLGKFLGTVFVGTLKLIADTYRRWINHITDFVEGVKQLGATWGITTESLTNFGAVFANIGKNLKIIFEAIWTLVRPLAVFIGGQLLESIRIMVAVFDNFIRTFDFVLSNIARFVQWLGLAATEEKKSVTVLREIADEIETATTATAAFKEETKEAAVATAQVRDYTKQIGDIRAGWGKKFAGLERSLELRITEVTGTDVEKETKRIEQRRQVELEKIKTYYETQQKTMRDHQEVLAASQEQYDRLRVKINETANLEIQQAQNNYYEEAAAAAQAAAEEEERIWEQEHQVLLGVLGAGAGALSTFFDEVFTDTGNAFQNFFTNLIDEIYKVVIELMVIKPIMKSITEAFKGGGGGGGFFESLLGGISSVFGGGGAPAMAFAGGGVINEPVVGVGAYSGSRYMLGEGGPELVTPLGASAAGGGAQYNITIQAMDTQSASDFMQRNPSAILGPVTSALQRGNKGLLGALRSTI